MDTHTLPRSRRALLAAGLGGLAALAAQALGRPVPVRAADPNDVVLGATNTATTTTKIQNLANNSTVFRSHSSGSGIGVEGSSGSDTGVWGWSDSGTGVYGSTVSGTGVYAVCQSGTAIWGWGISHIAVYGESHATDQAATVGQSKANATGLLGYSGGGGSLPTAPARTGVYGYAAQDASARGVTGQTTAGRGVNGVATSGRGVNGYAGTGIGGYFSAGPSGKALHAEGRVTFKTAGLATIGSGTASKTVTPGVDLTSSSKILCTLMGNAGGATTVKRVAVNTTTNAFTIHLTALSTAAVKVAWFVIG